MSSRYEQVWDGIWFDMPKTLDLACCDCGLVHHVRLRLRGGKLEACFNTDRRKTAAVRKGMKRKGNTI